MSAGTNDKTILHSHPLDNLVVQTSIYNAHFLLLPYDYPEKYRSKETPLSSRIPWTVRYMKSKSGSLLKKLMIGVFVAYKTTHQLRNGDRPNLCAAAADISFSLLEHWACLVPRDYWQTWLHPAFPFLGRFLLSWLDNPSGPRPSHCWGSAITLRQSTLGRNHVAETSTW